MLPRGQPFPFYEVNLEYIHAIFLHCSLYRPWEGLLDFLILLHFKIAFKRASAKFPLNFALRYGKQTVHDQFGLREAKAWQVSHHANNPSDAHAVIQCSGAFTNRQQWTLGTKTTLRSKARAPLNQFSQDDTKTVLDWLYRLRFFCLHSTCFNAFDCDGLSTRQIPTPFLSCFSSLLRSHKALLLFLPTAKLTTCDYLPKYSVSPSWACPINLYVLHAHTHTNSRRLCKHNIIGQRFEITASPSGEIVFLLAAVNW